ncbi:PH domain-containing protein, partial [Stenotrophomonas sp. BIIR7]
MSTQTPDDDAPDQRLHPWSWLFVLLMQLRQFLLPLVALVVFGNRGDRDEMWSNLAALVVIVVLVAISILQYLTYHYRIGRDAISVRSGVVSRNRREIPFARIHNVVVHQNPLHRMFNVAELRLESAGGNRPEAEMRVLRLDQALALEQL